VGGPEQPDYLNAVVIAETSMPAQAVLERCLSLEDAYGRVRDERWGPRTLDLDLIIYGDEVSNSPGLTLPHPRAHERAFVLAPWLDADPQAQIPGCGPVADLLAALGTAGIARVEGAVLHSPA
jgi:2-amino-4-hydroxy-6-hydroxymethyldihydropteridine diphosphokinase